MQQFAHQEKSLHVEKAALVMSSPIPSDLVLLLCYCYTTDFLQEATVDFLKTVLTLTKSVFIFF